LPPYVTSPLEVLSVPDEQLPLNHPPTGKTGCDETAAPASEQEGARGEASSAPRSARVGGSGSAEPAQRLAVPAPTQSRPSQSGPSPQRGGKRSGGQQSRGSAAGSASASDADDAGAELERRVGRAEFNDGALVRLRVPVRIDADLGRDVLTDIDVLAVDIDGRLRVSRSILECKSGKGQAGEPDRLLWLAGLQKFLGFARAVLVRQTVSRRGRSLARILGLRTLDVPTLTAREAAHAWVPERFAHVDGPECTGAERRTDAQLRGLGHLPADLVAFLRYDALRAEPHECLRAIAALGRAAESGGVLPNPTRLVLAGHALIALMCAAVSDAGRLDEISSADLLERTRRALVTGNPDDDQGLAILARADELTNYSLDRVHSAYQEAGAKRLQIGVPSLLAVVATPPPWVTRYVDLVEKLRANGFIARQMLQTIELAVFEALTGGTAHEAPAFDHLFTPEHRYLFNVAHRCLGDIAGAAVADSLSAAMDLNFERGKTQPGDRDVPSG
jgi:hypothetical protein